jgi:ferredoxin-thioredoxin reductase catalytic subunit
LGKKRRYGYIYHPENKTLAEFVEAATANDKKYGGKVCVCAISFFGVTS